MRRAILLLPLLAAAQDATFTSGVKVVNVLATVHNRQGQIVSNLTKEDFSLSEEGQAQTIRYFSRETDQPLTLGLLVDTSMSQRRVLGDEVRASYKFLQQVLREDKDQAFVIHFDHDVELLQDLTHSRAKLEKSLSDLDTPRQLQRSGDPGSGPRGRRGGGGGGGTALYDSVLLASNEVMKSQTGRKALILLTDGVDNGSKVGLTEAIEAAQKADTLVYSILFSDEHAGGGFNPGMRGGGRRGGGMGGNRMPPQRGNGGAADGKKVLRQLSADTGGSFFEITEKQPLDKTFSRIQEELRNQYNLGYVSSRTGEAGSFRSIRVSVESQKNLTVQARAGYYAK